jgi:hypothetical protein
MLMPTAFNSIPNKILASSKPQAEFIYTYTNAPIAM